MVTFELSQEDLVIALTNYMFETGLITENTPDGMMSFESLKDGGIKIIISECLMLDLEE